MLNIKVFLSCNNIFALLLNLFIFSSHSFNFLFLSLTIRNLVNIFIPIPIKNLFIYLENANKNITIITKAFIINPKAINF